MLYMVVRSDEAEAQRRAHEGFVLVLMFLAHVAGAMQAQECLELCDGKDWVEFYWDDHSGKSGVRIAWDLRNDRFMVHHGGGIWESSDGLRKRMAQMGFRLSEGLNMAYHNAEEAEMIDNWVSDGVGGYIRRPIYLREPMRLTPTMLSEVNGLVPTIWRVGSVILESQLGQL